MVEFLKEGKELPVSLKGQCIYYCGPTPAKTGRVMVLGSCGPTTSSRMDAFTPDVIKQGVKVFIGKGRRSSRVRECIKRKKAVYFIAPAGCGAYLSEKVVSSKVVAFHDLGPEAIFELKVKDFPAIVGIDSRGRDLYEVENIKL